MRERAGRPGTPVRPLARRLASVEVALSARAALCLSLPLVVGFVADRHLDAILFDIGALWAVSQDGLDQWTRRGPRMLAVAVAAALGVAAGGVVATRVGTTLAVALCYAVVALVAGLVEATFGATAGAYLIVGATLGVGLDPVGRVPLTAGLMAAGALWVWAVARVANLRRRRANQRAVLAAAFDDLGLLARAVGSPAFSAVRAGAVASLDLAQDVVSRPNATAVGDALFAALVVALRAGEAVSYLEGRGQGADASLVEALEEVARHLREGETLHALTHLERLAGDEALAPAVRRALAPPSAEELAAAGAVVSSHRATRPAVPVRERLRFGAILAVAVVGADLLGVALHGPHAFWLPMSVVFILRPDLGPVMARALARTLGTVLGVGVAALVALVGHSPVDLIVLSCVMAAIVPPAQRRGNVAAVVAFTPLVFVFLGLAASAQSLFVTRIVDTALAAALVLVIDGLLWTTAPSRRPAALVAAARAALAHYGAVADADPATRHLARRAALRALARARAATHLTRGELRAVRRGVLGARGELDALEAEIDATTVRLLERPVG
ncbi:MAG TPA: FUSC family protein [Acidimicrobiales bacterium]|nr:FUSC family protein [Acidimicrobiales bacterium]